MSQGNAREVISNAPEIDAFRTTAAAIRAELAKAIVGQDEVVRHVLIGLVSNGHTLLELSLIHI